MVVINAHKGKEEFFNNPIDKEYFFQMFIFFYKTIFDYIRISCQDQNESRQLQDIKGFDYVFTNKCSGSIAFFNRAKGPQIIEPIDQKKLAHLPF
ncbi:MAG: hypothetical protein M1292_07870 [Bacteroidetes bacterium]|nr:hypothetical protein [Bacteroidota bacterium]